MSFEVGQQVLCRIGYDWVPAIVRSVGEHHHEDNDLVLPAGNVFPPNNINDIDGFDEEDFPGLQVGAVVPYRVELKRPIRMQGGNREPQRIASIAQDDEWYIRELTGSSIVWHAGEGLMEDDVWQQALTAWIERFTYDNGMEEANDLLREAVSSRFQEVAEFIAILKEIPLKPIGRELWEVFVAGDQSDESTYSYLPEDEDVLAAVQLMSQMFEWLETECGVRDLQRYYGDEERGLHAEHIAAEKGDVMLLCWLMERQWSHCRLPSDRPTRRDGVLEDVTSNRLSFPRDDKRWTPLHYAAVNGRHVIIDAYRFRGEDSILSSMHRNFWLAGIEEFDALTISGESALDLAKDNRTRQSLLQVRKRLYQAILNESINSGRLPAGYTDFSDLERLIAEHGLDVDEATASSEHDLYNRDGITIALESGNIVLVQFLVRLLRIDDISRWRDQDGQTMLHIAAGRPSRWFAKQQEDEERIRNEDHWNQDHGTQQVHKLAFMKHNWSGSASFTDELKKYLEKSKNPNHLRTAIGGYREQCEETEKTQVKIKLCHWLIQRGVPIPECSFIVERCDFAIARMLLDYRLKVDRIIDKLFQDKAPLAMESVKQFLYLDAQEARLKASEIAVLCVQRPHYDRLLCVTDVCRLLLLHWLCNFVNVIRIETSSGDTILHEAVRAKETLIAAWLAREYPRLAHSKGPSGQLPVHLALDRVAEDDDTVEKGLCMFMILYVGEARSGYNAWRRDQRAWAIPDASGRTVKEYAISCSEETVRKEARKSGRKNAYSRMISMLSDESNSVQTFEQHVNENGLEDASESSEWNEIRFLHSCIGLARLDILKWYEQKFYQREDPVHCGLGRYLGNNKDPYEMDKWLPRVFCSKTEQFSPGNSLEVLGKCPRETGQTGQDFALGGWWMVHRWEFWSNRTYNIRIEDNVCRTDVAGLENATFTIGSGSGQLHHLLKANNGREIWDATHIEQTVKGGIVTIRLKRRSVRGREQWANDGRELVFTKVESRTDDASEGPTWQKAWVVASTPTELTIAYNEVDPPHQEVIAQNSPRINRTGSFASDYIDGCGAMDDFRFSKQDGSSFLISGLDLARRYGHESIAEWIEEGISRAEVGHKLESFEREFLRKFFSDSSSEDLEQVISEANKIASSASLSSQCKNIVLHLQSQLHILGGHWNSQTELMDFDTSGCAGYNVRLHKKLGLLRCAARVGRLDRVEWVISRGFHSDSDVAIGALFDAAYRNNVDIVKALLSKHVDATQVFPFSAFAGHDDLDQHDQTETTLIKLSVEELSSDVVSFLIENGHVPAHHLHDELLERALRRVFAFTGEAPRKPKKHTTSDRLSILKKLTSAGLVIEHNATRVIEEALSRLSDRRLSEEIEEIAPVTRELVCWLCSQGCDLPSAVRRQSWLFDEERPMPSFLTKLVELSETVWPVSNAVARGTPIDEVESLLQRSGTDIDAIRDPQGRSLMHVAVLSNQAQCLEWLVRTKGADINEKDSDGFTVLDRAQQNGLDDMVSMIRRLQQEVTDDMSICSNS